MTEGVTKGFILLPPAAHLCQVCAHDHPSDQPHNAQTLFYQTKFFMDHGRAPTWMDATGHCSPEVREHWLSALRDLGVDVDAGKVHPAKGGARG